MKILATATLAAMLVGPAAAQTVNFDNLQPGAPPPGWTAQHLLIAGLAARYHRGALPGPSHQDYSRLRLSMKNTVNFLAGIIRFADAFDCAHDGSLQQIKVADLNGALTIEALGYQERTRAAEKISAARHLLESVLKRPILVLAPKPEPNTSR